MSNTLKLKECCTIIAGQSPESKYYNTEGIGIPFFQGKADFGDVYPRIRVYCSQPTKPLRKMIFYCQFAHLSGRQIFRQEKYALAGGLLRFAQPQN